MAAPDNALLGVSSNSFALDLYKTLAADKSRENMCMSPVSILVTLGMARLGMRGSSSAQLAATLNVSDIEAGELNKRFSALHASLNPSNQTDYQLNIANKIFTRKGHAFKEEFLNATSTIFGSSAQQMDFAADAEGSRQAINNWVESQTNHKITDLMQAGTITPMTALILANAVYFKGSWETEFKKNETHKREFYVSGTETIEVDMMHKNAKFAMGYDEELQAQSVELDYKGGDFSLVIILPMNETGLADVESKMTGEKLHNLCHPTESIKGDLFLPRFKVEMGAPLREQLSQLGATDMFIQGQADLSGMDGSRALYVSQVVHKAFIAVNEEGTEAAAATGMQIMLMSMPPQITVDHPFMFVLKHKPSGSALFVGRVTRPISP